MIGPVTAKGRYEQLQTEREPYLRRGREAAELTIPSLLPKQGHGGSSDLPTPYQGMGARGTNNLSSKLLLALFPPNNPFFRLTIDDFTLQELTGNPDLRTEMEKTLGAIERTVMNEVEANSVRVSAFETLKLLLVTGNALVYLPPEGGMKVYRLDKYVVKRDPLGHVIDIVIYEKIAFVALPEKTKEALRDGDKLKDRKPNDELEIYTWVKREGNRYTVIQECEGVAVDGSDGHYPLDKTPWLPLRFTKIDGEDYGRGHVEEYMGDLRSLEGLSRAIVEGSAAAAKVLFLVNPNGMTDERTISDAPNLGVRSGNADDVSVLQLDKFADFRVAADQIVRIESRLAQAFLLTSSVQRQAERVTAEEIRLMAGELEDALGGVYSILSQEFQLPLVKRLMHQLQRQRRLPPLPEKQIKPAIVTGMEALGRGHDLNRLMTFGQIVQGTIGPDEFREVINTDDYVSRVGTGLGIDMNGLVRSREEIDARRSQAIEVEKMRSLGPAQINAEAKIAQEQIKNDGAVAREAAKGKPA